MGDALVGMTMAASEEITNAVTPKVGINYDVSCAGSLQEYDFITRKYIYSERVLMPGKSENKFMHLHTNVEFPESPPSYPVGDSVPYCTSQATLNDLNNPSELDFSVSILSDIQKVLHRIGDYTEEES